ncbi:hypothetical protein [Streptomyces sp. NPDC052721]|uniref:hypothetical protein n=1 Tax=Streptomyces sp. NPDC052721 TaxID=3154955 RepID=UPI003412205D
MRPPVPGGYFGDHLAVPAVGIRAPLAASPGLACTGRTTGRGDRDAPPGHTTGVAKPLPPAPAGRYSACARRAVANRRW